jgi:hypothetical protein
MPELGPYGSVRGARGNSRPYRESGLPTVKTALLTRSRHWLTANALFASAREIVVGRAETPSYSIARFNS